MQQRVWIRGLGVYLPEASLTNEAIEAGMPWLRTSAQWISEHTGIYKRHVARPDQHAADLGYLAAVEALELSQSEPESIDLIMLATNTSQYVYPAGAGRIQNAFGTGAGGQLRMGRAGALDLQQGCSSFIGAIGLASGLIRGQLFRNVLVVGADVATRMVDWTNRDSILLGDAAAACVVSAGEPPQGLDPAPIEVLGHFMRTDPTAADAVFQRGVLNVAHKVAVVHGVALLLGRPVDFGQGADGLGFGGLGLLARIGRTGGFGGGGHGGMEECPALHCRIGQFCSNQITRP